MLGEPPDKLGSRATRLAPPAQLVLRRDQPHHHRLITLQLRMGIQVAFHAHRFISPEPVVKVCMHQLDKERLLSSPSALQVILQRGPAAVAPSVLETLQRPLQPLADGGR